MPEMIPVAGRTLKVGHEFRQPGEPVPEALDWNPRVVERLMNQHMLKVPLSGTAKVVGKSQPSRQNRSGVEGGQTEHGRL